MRHIVTLKTMEQKATKRTQLEDEIASTLDDLAGRQGVEPISDFEALLGHPSSEDESPEEFAAMLRQWRREASRSLHQ